MSVQLAKNEKVVRSYDYATAQKGGLASTSITKSLVVTNKRIIHKEVGTGKNNEFVKTSEMPVSSAKYVNTYYQKLKFPIFLVWGIIFAVIALVAFLAIPEEIADFKALAFLPLILGVIFILVYIFKKQYIFVCTIDTDTHITPAFGFSSVSRNSKTDGITAVGKKGNKTTSIEVVINPETAKQMADEIGSVIMAAVNGDYDEEVAPVAAPLAMEVPVVEVEAPVVEAEAPVAEEAPAAEYAE